MTASYTVHGMTCEHCVASVRETVSEIEGVGDIAVELDSGALLVTGEGFTDDAVKAAVEEAGYALAGPASG